MRSEAQQPMSVAEQFKADVPERSDPTDWRADLSGTAQGGQGRVGGLTEEIYPHPQLAACERRQLNLTIPFAAALSG